MSEEARKELDEAADALKDLSEELKLPFNRWLIKLIVEKLLVPRIVTGKQEGT